MLREMGAALLGFVILVVVLFGIGWAVQGNEFFLAKVFMPKYEQVRRNTFEQSKAYRQGMVQELQNMQLEYVRGTPEQKQAVASIILHRAADLRACCSGLLESDPELLAFINELRGER